MSSSTSSSSPSSHEAAPIVGFLAGLILFCELGLRFLEPRLSVDLQHIRAIPSIAQELDEARALRVLFLGNSLTRAGVDSEVFIQSSNRLGLPPLQIARVFPDDSRIGEWIYVFDHHFVATDRVPDVVVVSFARDHLADHHRLAIERIAAFYTSAGDIPEIFARDVPGFEDRVGFLLAFGSRAFALRDRVSRRVLDLVPGYRATANRINRDIRAGAQVTPGSGPRGYERLARLIQLARSNHARAVFVAMPIRRPYALDGALARILAERGAGFVDAREIDGLSSAHFRDALHLTDDGARTYSGRLAELLQHELRAALPTRTGRASIVPKR